ncbi:uncharacterized protein LOC116719398 [Xiphophorus hellerii]|uniref:uncharacterized protein LOC116716303 n=1 Tax=Xiphophorus hellerii TaxID=8084 RepID=UPI0013B469E2|nr:uncharacterized protein LOC116716303 [Xiphophorus hellerii]XP_032417794.1 uncharacterized protein LOC116719398 [Xiphophorus hellerii]
MPRRGRRSEAAKVRWRKLEIVPVDAKPGTPPLTTSAWNPTRSPPKKMSPLLDGGLPNQVSPPMVRQEEPRVPPTSPGSRRGTGRRHRVETWPASRVTRRSCKLVLPTAEALEKKFALLVGDSHLRAIVDGYSTMPKGDFFLGVLASPGASAEELRLEVLDAVLPRPPEVICLLAPSNNLTASRTFVEAGAAFDALLSTVCNLSANVVVVDFPPRLCVEDSVQQLLRQEFQRVAAQRSVRYLPVTEHFPLSSLALWSRDGVHLSDHPGMEVLAQLLEAAVCSQLELSASKSPAPVMLAPPPLGTASPPAVRRCLTQPVVVTEVAAPRRSEPYAWTVVGGGRKGDLLDSSIPLNPVCFSPALLEDMDRIVPASGLETPLPICSPKVEKKASAKRRSISDPYKLNPVEQQMEGASRESNNKARRQAQSPVPPMDVQGESSSVPQEDHFWDGSCKASALEPGISGPPVLLVSATHSQADKRYAAFSRNHQCTCMALTFLAYHNEGLQFDTVMLDRVIEKGDQLYAGVKQQLISDGTFRDNHLTFEQMPDHVLTDRNIYAVHTTGLRVGHVFARSRSTQGSRQLGLHLALQLKCLSENVTHAFLLVTPECIAVFRDRSGRFGVFDSHSRNSAGLPHPSGTAVMMTFCNLSDLVSHLLKLFRNRGPNATYEFVPVGFDRENEDHPQNLTFDNISPVATQVSPTALKSESPSDEEMPPWLREVANVLEERPTTVTNLSKVPKTDRRKIKNRIKTQQRQNVGSKMKQSSSEKERYLTSPTFRTKKLQAVKEKYILHQVERKDHLNNRYRTDASFRKRRRNYMKDRFNFVRTFTESHKAKMAEYMRKRFRDDPIFRSRKKSNIRNQFRDDQDFRSRKKSNIRNRFRNDPVFRSKHKKIMREYMKAKYHSEPAYRAKHKEKCAANRRGRLTTEARSKNVTLQHALRIRNKYKRNVSFHLETPSPLITDEMKAAIRNFYKNIKNGPTYVCTVCHRALFPNQVKHCKRDKYTKNMRVVADSLTGTYVHVCGSACSTPCSVPQERKGEWICYTCDSHLTRGKMPSIAAVNNLHLASVPPELAELNVLERQLIAKILPFAKIVSLPKGQQRAIHGAVVCVPSDMETVVNSLPRPREEAQLLQVKLKRKTKYKGYQYFYTVNMKNVLAALTKLKDSHPDYKEISINESATFEDFQEDQQVEDLETEAAETEMDIEADQQPDHIGIEHQALRPGLILDTCMQPPDIAQEVLSYGEGIFSIAPAQGNKPISFFSVPRLEANAYPVHFPTGINTLDEARRVALSPSMYFNVRLFSIDICHGNSYCQ